MSTFDFDFESPAVFVLIELMGRDRLAGRAWACPAGGWYVQAFPFEGLSMTSPFYVGPCAVFRMTEVDEAIARETARCLPPVLPPSWMVATKPTVAPKVTPPKYRPPPLDRVNVGDSVKLGGPEWMRIIDIGRKRVYFSNGLGLDVTLWDRDVTDYNEEIPF